MRKEVIILEYTIIVFLDHTYESYIIRSTCHSNYDDIEYALKK